MEIVDSLMVKIALIGLLGIGAQWIAWRTGRPAIALMLIVGIIAGPGAWALLQPIMVPASPGKSPPFSAVS